MVDVVEVVDVGVVLVASYTGLLETSFDNRLDHRLAWGRGKVPTL